jgi:hypothetical protein
MSIEQTGPAGGEATAAPVRLPFDDVIGAIYRIALGRPGDHDIFRGALVRWTDFIAPIVLSIAINLTYEIARDAPLRAAMNASFKASLIVFGILIGGLLLRVTVALTVTRGIGGGLSTPDRVGPGLLAFQWAQAVWVTPWVILGRLLIGTHGPEWLVLLLGAGIVVAMVGGVARVMRVAFALPTLGQALFVALAGPILSYIVDRLLGMII